MKAFDPERACPGFTLFAPLFVESRTVYLIDLQGKVVHTWKMPYSPGLSGYLTERATLYYNGRYPEDNFLSRFPFKGGVALEADWSGKVLWEVRHPGQHHDGVLLRNGNVLLDCMGEVPAE
ncbi:MAG: aryl sulfotransferase, partial [Gemmatimonadetes bacterium]